ncbi:ABC transporter ATP-binding protein [Achromobacter sp. GG226]|uniref:ABC transporter ATP-binding protein n=1 Tax=Verticiella alkaliphila TaxID=2779529 RepID=UPI001C0C5467|nr:ABC transporter ATP-binding protein [Verticiella sp. GG226]MBU4611686.1 ABC transporter ATP-binding protein [Verticiella sp. GG226]
MSAVASPAPLLRTQGLVKRYGGLLVTDAVSMEVLPNQVHAIIGPNGAGKTTLINQLSGEIGSNEGTVWFEGRDVTSLPVSARARQGLLRSYQITSIFEDFTVLENATFAAMGARGKGLRFWRPMLADGELHGVAQKALVDTGLAARADDAASALGYGERRQLELAMALAASPKVLLLDEPMAGMSVQESVAVVALLQRLKRDYAIVLIEHDMQAVFALADRISVLVYGRVVASGTPDEIRQDPEVRRAYLGDEEIA